MRFYLITARAGEDLLFLANRRALCHYDPAAHKKLIKTDNIMCKAAISTGEATINYHYD